MHVRAHTHTVKTHPKANGGELDSWRGGAFKKVTAFITFFLYFLGNLERIISGKYQSTLPFSEKQNKTTVASYRMILGLLLYK